MAGKSFLRDPDQAAELAALLQDTADALEVDLRTSAGSTRRELAQAEQTIARYRRWADEMTPDAPETEPAAPVQIRPRRDVEEATG